MGLLEHSLRPFQVRLRNRYYWFHDDSLELIALPLGERKITRRRRRVLQDLDLRVLRYRHERIKMARLSRAEEHVLRIQQSLVPCPAEMDIRQALYTERTFIVFTAPFVAGFVVHGNCHQYLLKFAEILPGVQPAFLTI